MPIQSCGQSVSARRGKRYTEIGVLLTLSRKMDECQTLARGQAEEGAHSHAESYRRQRIHQGRAVQVANIRTRVESTPGFSA